MERNPFTQSFTFQTKLEQQAGAGQTVDVSCQRAYFLLGEYSCSKRAGL